MRACARTGRCYDLELELPEVEEPEEPDEPPLLSLDDEELEEPESLELDLLSEPLEDDELPLLLSPPLLPDLRA